MDIDVVTLFPELIREVERHGVTGRAAARGLVSLRTWNPRDRAGNRQGRVDDRAYGGGPGMVMQVAPLRDTLTAIRHTRETCGPVLALTPQGERFSDGWARRLAQAPHLVLVCGRYEGIDQRVLDADIDAEISLGDFVVSGGELPAMLLLDAVIRLLPGALGDDESAADDSFAAGLLDHPHYTRPPGGDEPVPPVLLSGDHAAIRRWRLKQALGRTWLHRPDLLDALTLTDEQRVLLAEFVAETGAGE
ncbi:tRNA (guanosine(37)-N1)-methyltransferase TrmD [Spectribacter hydrogenoxidans]|uniref:tRNA (guanine-N(1)-)-methyltransferase n=1 Tax=Spectribacter hydrogenoxidans TaxID=3075608 RepID=A0ABU3BXK5_9GAMM|nr:tRNA (guanosine(37)-N1)-methyltransferase TrmD [Salinisphaera sp. W335]MDT0634046.1 tRNA (guanosine(37)-N1)-methyltransferase TrmD [Salinisphaera sp. W335]